MKSTRAALISAPRSLEIVDRPTPRIAADQVRIRMEGCGVCASNLPVWEGRPWFDYPREPGSPGHEGWGVAEEVGSQVEGVRPGDRVATLSTHAFASHDVARADEVVVLPSSLDGCPMPGEPLACAMNVFRRSDIEPGQTVAVVGVGFLGALLIQLARDAGAEVIGISRRDSALAIAEACGAGHRVRFDEAERVAERVDRIAGPDGCARVIEAVGNQAALDVASALVAVRGRLVLAGYHQDGMRRVDMQSWNWRGIDVVNAHERDPRIYVRGMLEAIEAVEQGRLDPAPLMTHHFPLQELPRALELGSTRPDGYLKSLISFS